MSLRGLCRSFLQINVTARALTPTRLFCSFISRVEALFLLVFLTRHSVRVLTLLPDCFCCRRRRENNIRIFAFSLRVPFVPLPPLQKGREQQEQLAEARLRFVAAVKANYQDNFRKGWLSDSGLRVLMVSHAPLLYVFGTVRPVS